MEDHNYFVPHRTDLIETYVSLTLRWPWFILDFNVSEIACRGKKRSSISHLIAPWK
jgi:hypothetical protein